MIKCILIIGYHINPAPSIGGDPQNDSWWRSTLESAQNWIEAAKEDAENNDGGTIAIGANFSGAFAAAVSVSGGITFDHHGNIGFIGTTAGGGGTPSLSLSGFFTTTDAPFIYNQAGMGFQTGGSVSLGLSIGAEYCGLIDMVGNQNYDGSTVLIGIGASTIVAEGHGELSHSWVWGFNIYDSAIEFIDWILSIPEQGGIYG